MSISHINQHQLAKRWDISPRTLERWRWKGEGPSYMKIGCHVLYRLEDIEQFESENLRDLSKSHEVSTTDPDV